MEPEKLPVAGETLDQLPVAGSEEAEVPSRFITKLFVTIAAFAGSGASVATKPDATSAVNATNAGNFPHIWRIERYTLANISGL